MRILYLTPTAVFSGGERVTLSIAAEMQRRGHETVYCGLEGPIRGFVENANVRFLPLSGFTPGTVRAAAAAAKPELIHAMDFRASTYAALLAPPLLAHLHNNPPWLTGFGPNTWGMRFFCERAARILTVSDSVMGEYRFGKRCLKKTTVLPNVVDVAAVRAAAQEPPVGVPPDARFDLLFFGRLTEQKQPLRFLSIVTALRRELPALRVLMIGDGELRGQVEAAVRVNGLADCVTLAGFCEKPFPLAARCRLLLMPSAWEGFGLTAVEAMALGLPVLAAPVGGLRGVVAADCGALCETEPDYVEAAVSLLSNDARYAAASRAARLRAEVFADAKHYFDTVAALSEAAAGRKPT